MFILCSVRFDSVWFGVSVLVLGSVSVLFGEYIRFDAGFGSIQIGARLDSAFDAFRG